MKEEYHQWNSLYLNRDFEMLVFGHDGFPVVLFPGSKGRFYEAKDNGLIHAASNFIESGKIKIYCPDSIDGESWYNYSILPEDRVKKHLEYETLIINDVIAFAKHETGYHKVMLAGYDLGAYHSVNLAFRHPNLVDSIITMDGIIDIKRYIMGYYNDNCYFNNPLDYLPGLDDPWYIERMMRMEIVIGVSQFNNNKHESEKLSHILRSKNIAHQYLYKASIENNFKGWCEMFPEGLSKMSL